MKGQPGDEFSFYKQRAGKLKPGLRMIHNITSYTTPLLLTVAILLAAMLRLHDIDRESFWLDEAHSYWDATTSPKEILKTSIQGNKPPLYYLILHYWMKSFGESDGAMRLLSAIFGILAIPVVFQIGRLLFHERFGLAAAFFLTVSGFHIQYSQEARFYSLYFLLIGVSILCFLLTRQRARYAWIGYVLSTVLLLYTHNMAFPFAVSIMLLYLLSLWPWKLSKLRPFLLASLAVFLLYASWIPVYWAQAARVQEGFWTPQVSVKFARQTLEKLFLPAPRKVVPLTVQLAVPLSILVLAIPALWHHAKKKLMAASLFLLVPVGATLIASMAIRNIFIPRVLIPVVLPLCFLLAIPILMAKEIFPLRRKLALVAMCSMWLISLVGAVSFLRHHSKEPWRQGAGFFQKHYINGDGVVYLLASNERAFARYLPPSLYDIPVVAIPGDRFSRAVPRRIEAVNNRHDRDGTAAMETLKETNTRLWLVRRYDEVTKSREKALTAKTVTWLDVDYKRLREWKLGIVEIVLYEPLVS